VTGRLVEAVTTGWVGGGLAAAVAEGVAGSHCGQRSQGEPFAAGESCTGSTCVIRAVVSGERVAKSGGLSASVLASAEAAEDGFAAADWAGFEVCSTLSVDKLTS
jgi:hypothetical protein